MEQQQSSVSIARRGIGAPIFGVFDALHSNRQALHRNLQAAAQRLPLARGAGSGQPAASAQQRLPFAHVAASLSKAMQQDVPAALAAAAARLSVAIGGVQQHRQQQKATQQAGAGTRGQRQRRTHGASPHAGDVVCTEYTKGKRRVYRRRRCAADEADGDGSGSRDGRGSSTVDITSKDSGGFVLEDDVVERRQRLNDLAADYLLPQGYPESVAPQYAPYMRARAWQYLFGGALSVFTTRSLLSSLGVANKASGEAAAAINWVVKDGAGRLGRFLFARWGRDLDCELKQFRLAGDLLMEAGAALELSTALMPTAFLPLACTANLAKNLAAVAIVSTRAPIYRTFALRNNLADVTAKGESVANLADVVGTVLGIVLAKSNLPVVPTFTLLSLGYLAASRVEVATVILPYLNRARLSYVARTFYNTGKVPGLEEGNSQEPIMPFSDPHNNRVVLGATVEDACTGPQQLQEALSGFSGRQYALTYRPDTRKCYALLKDGASMQSVLQAAMDAHCIIWMLDQQQQQQQQQQQGALGTAAAAGAGAGLAGKQQAVGSSSGNGGSNGCSAIVKLHAAVQQLGSVGEQPGGSSGGLGQEALDYVARSDLFKEFSRQAVQHGWRLNMTSLNPRETRLALA